VPTAQRAALSGGVALGGTALAFASLYLAAGALMPLLVVYQERWHLSAALLTLTFAVFAGGFLAALLTVGAVSDHLGRRPVLMSALVVQLASNVIFLAAPDIGWVITGRVVQGVATGTATTAFTAALVELAPPNRKKLGAIAGSVGLTGGLGLGSLLAGLTIQVTDDANSVIFIVLTIVTVVGLVAVALSPETVTAAPGALRSLLPRIAIPAATRGELSAAVPVIAAIWMLSGLTGGLAPSMVRSVFMLNSGLLNGISGFVSPAAAAVIGLAFGGVDPRRAMIIGGQASVCGVVGIAGGALTGSLTTMIIGQAVAGAAFGAAFTASLRLIVPLAQAHQRAGVAAAVYLVSYLAFGIPIVVAGRIAGSLGVVPTVSWYGAVTVLLALVGLLAQRRLRCHRGSASSPVV
jgi:MFS family permease